MHVVLKRKQSMGKNGYLKVWLIRGWFRIEILYFSMTSYDKLFMDWHLNDRN